MNLKLIIWKTIALAEGLFDDEKICKLMEKIKL